MARQQTGDQRRVGRRRRPDHDARRAPGEHLRDGLLAAQAAADLDRDLRGGEKRPRQPAVVASAEGTVQVNKMHPARAGVRESGGDRERVVGVRGRLVRVGPARAHYAPALHVHGGVEIHPM